MYFGIFSHDEKRRLTQIFNAINMLGLSYHYFTNPEATFAEDGFAFLSSLLNFYALGDGRDGVTEFSAWMMSSAYSGAIFTNVLQETSEIPFIFNVWQSMLLNPMNIYFGVTTNIDEEVRLKNA